MLWLVFFFVLVVDYYIGCQWTGVDGMCLYGSRPIFGTYGVNALWFFANWCCMLVWYGVLISFAERIRNFFRLPTTTTLCTSVRVSVPTEGEEILSMYPAPFVRVLRALSRGIALSCGGSATSVTWRHQTVLVQTSEAGTKFFEFECQRYVLSEATELFESPTISVGETFEEIAANGEGLTEAEARRRMELLGANQIPFEMDTMAQAVGKEFFSFFYLYQLLIYSVWFWWSYLVVACCLFCVVLLSAAGNIYMSLKGQQTIQKLSKYSTPVRLNRLKGANGGLVEEERSSMDMVVGDLVSVAGDWILPCDMVVLRGSAVCDESGLTGESKPVRKVEIPVASAAAYDPMHGGGKHTLFAGTRVLQADSVTAVVAATGVRTSKGELVSQVRSERDKERQARDRGETDEIQGRNRDQRRDREIKKTPQRMHSSTVVCVS